MIAGGCERLLPFTTPGARIWEQDVVGSNPAAPTNRPIRVRMDESFRRLLQRTPTFSRRASICYRPYTADPAYLACAPSSSSMRRSWLYLATRSPRQGAPVLRCPAPVATVGSAMKL